MSILANSKDLVKYRALLSALVVRHLAVRYRGSALGFLWSVLNPLALMLIYFLVFHYYIRFAAVEHYAIFLFTGLLPWVWATSALVEGAQSVVNSGHLITKSLFPAQILPIVAVLTGLVNFLLSLPLLLLFMWYEGVAISPTVLLLPAVVTLQFLFLTGAVLGLSALNVRYRDVQHLLANILSFLFFLCPIVYPAASVPEKFRFTLDLNPFALFVQAYHNILFEGVVPSAMFMIYLCAWTVLMLLVGNLVFERFREGFAEAL